MVDTGQVSEVEDVVEFGWSGREVSYNALIQLHSSSSDGLGQLLDVYS